MKLHDLDIFGGIASLLVDLLRTSLGHPSSHQLNRRVVIECVLRVRHHVNTKDLHSLILEIVSNQEFFIADYSTSSSIRSRTALELGERRMYHLSLLNLLQRVLISELAIGIVHTVKMILPCNFGKVFWFGSKLFDMLPASVPKELRSERALGSSIKFLIFNEEGI